MVILSACNELNVEDEGESEKSNKNQILKNYNYLCTESFEFANLTDKFPQQIKINNKKTKIDFY